MVDKTAAARPQDARFPLPATGGKKWKLADAAGRNLVIYFYPRDATSGCTQEGEAFRDLHAQFRKAGTEIVGVSPDSVASHEKFKAKYGFPFELLADEDRRPASCSTCARRRACTAGSTWASNAAPS